MRGYNMNVCNIVMLMEMVEIIRRQTFSSTTTAI